MHLIFFLMCAGLDGLEGLEPFEDLEDLVNFEAFCFFVLLEGGLLLLEFSGLVGGWEREAGLEGDLEDGRDPGRDGGSEDGSPEVAEVESLPSWTVSVLLWALAGRSWEKIDITSVEVFKDSSESTICTITCLNPCHDGIKTKYTHALHVSMTRQHFSCYQLFSSSHWNVNGT